MGMMDFQARFSWGELSSASANPAPNRGYQYHILSFQKVKKDFQRFGSPDGQFAVSAYEAGEESPKRTVHSLACLYYVNG